MAFLHCTFTASPSVLYKIHEESWQHRTQQETWQPCCRSAPGQRGLIFHPASRFWTLAVPWMIQPLQPPLMREFWKPMQALLVSPLCPLFWNVQRTSTQALCKRHQAHAVLPPCPWCQHTWGSLISMEFVTHTPHTSTKSPSWMGPRSYCQC